MVDALGVVMWKTMTVIKEKVATPRPTTTTNVSIVIGWSLALTRGGSLQAKRLSIHPWLRPEPTFISIHLSCVSFKNKCLEARHRDH